MVFDFFAINSSEVQVVVARTGLLIKGLAVLPGLSGGNAGAIVGTLTGGLESADRKLLILCSGLMLVLIATVGTVGGSGAGFVGSVSD